jgi:hypothetical protein
MILVGHVARVVRMSNACNLLEKIIDHMILVGHVARIVWLSNACKHFGRNHR